VKTLAVNLMPVAKATRVGAAGGVIQGDRGATITVPAGALAQDTLISLTLLPAKDYFVGYNTSELVDGFKVFPDGVTFLKPVQVKLPLNARLPAETEIVFAMFHSDSMNFGAPLKGKVTDDGRYLAFSMTGIESYLVPQSDCVWQDILGTEKQFVSGVIRKQTSQYCENHQQWSHEVNQPLAISVEGQFSIPGGGKFKVLGAHYDYNWNEIISCNSDWCRRHTLVAITNATVTGCLEMCLEPNVSAKEIPAAFKNAPKRFHVTSVSYQDGYDMETNTCRNGLTCENDNNLCTKDICQDGECVHPDNEKAIACKSTCNDCDPNTGMSVNYRCKKCEHCERMGPPEYGKCVPECITDADCPDPADPCYRAICRADHCCGQEAVGDPPCDK
jgi:hypothetical protein